MAFQIWCPKVGQHITRPSVIYSYCRGCESKCSIEPDAHDTRPGIIIAWGKYGSMNITQDLSGSWLLGHGGIACRPTITS
jgi:hypothetical protein